MRTEAWRVATVLAAFLGVAPVAAQVADPPCLDGVFHGDVGAHYQSIFADGHLDPSDPSSPVRAGSRYAGLAAEKRAYVDECRGRSGADSLRYREREVVTVGGRVVGRMYDYLDLNTATRICTADRPSDPDAEVTCGTRTGPFYYVALVLSGCFTDNVFGDPGYAASVGWTEPPSAGFERLRLTDGVDIGGFCAGDAAPRVSLDAVGRRGGPADGAQMLDVDAIDFDEGAGAAADRLPVGFQMATSTVWNMVFSNWHVEDLDADGREDVGPDENGWNAPFDGGGVQPGNLCDARSGCAAAYADTWFDDAHLWEWPVVYELRWDVAGCPSTDLEDLARRVRFDDAVHASPAKPGFVACSEGLAGLTLIEDTRPDDPFAKFTFTVTGPDSTLQPKTLQDWGSNECPPPSTELSDGTPVPGDCDDGVAWTHPDSVTWGDIASTNNPAYGSGTAYTIRQGSEPGDPSSDDGAYETAWECRTFDPVACDVESLLGLGLHPFEACDEIPPGGLSAAVDGASSCRPHQGSVGRFAGTGSWTGPFSICDGEHLVCEFSNQGTVDGCLESDLAAGDLAILGDGPSAAVGHTAAAISVVQPGVPDSLFLTSLIPIADEARWPASIHHFVQPLPVRDDGSGRLVPDVSVRCSSDLDTSCLAWEAGAEILAQAPDAAGVHVDRRIGAGEQERRVTYTTAAVGDAGGAVNGQAYPAVPRQLRAFDYAEPRDDAELEHDLWRGFGLRFVAGSAADEDRARFASRAIIRDTLAVRERSIRLGGSPPQDLEFVVGDGLHGDPVLVAGPGDAFALARDLGGNGRACDDTARPNPGYRCFYKRHRRRRRVLLMPSNDGQIHAFDAGVVDIVGAGGALPDAFTLGTGREVFAHIPRPMLAHTAAALRGEHAFGIDGGITVADVFVDPVHGGEPEVAERQWRTAAVVSYRSGARGYAMLDLTTPDPVTVRTVTDPATGLASVAFVPDPGGSYVPGCNALAGPGAGGPGGRPLPHGCDELAYPSVQWEFDDRCPVGVSVGDVTYCDEDGNGFPDLGFSWSKVNVGRIRVLEPGDTAPSIRTVAVFGGGLDPAALHASGNYLYMVDVETGRAIYKRSLAGAAPSEPAAVDADFDGFLDTVYIGTTLGGMYRVDISTPAPIDAASGRVEGPTEWRPVPIFDTGGRPVFFPPQVLFVASIGSYALAFGTGDRSDLWSETYAEAEGRFYMIVDPGFVADTDPVEDVVLGEADYVHIGVDDAASAADHLAAPQAGLQAGWILDLGEGERLVADALAVSGLLSFSTFDPERRGPCDLGGRSRVFTVAAQSADPLGASRYLEVDGQLAGRAVVTSSGMRQTNAAPDESDPPQDPFDAGDMQDMRFRLRDLFPDSCRFGSFSVDLSVALTDRGQVPVARIPVCVAPKNWRELF